MSAVRKVETLVADWEIGNLVVADGKGKAKPVVERRVFNLVMQQVALCVGDCAVANLAAPAFNKRYHKRVGGGVD